ncbi:tRNA N6-adenosine threonylcarbamoyltransferase [Burkholderia lata]|uniref:tRNA N6-adenosine threonylcarbamoyltransferase n=2 Tax=Burkholderia lata (strain ATCC 17760 / DSM 23089 / LMG 22485 / NCIMB 9086 / R18194 / 383) TaxID=482957 RepID=A0A6P2KLT8_BURL3|nr:tRNA N6-adenosine threonylcarbamoyltransferase [Burkholderia lata]
MHPPGIGLSTTLKWSPLPACYNFRLPLTFRHALLAARPALTMLVLGIESSCDETGLALYDTQRGLLAHALHSQIAMHREYGGVVPELASRDHIRRALPLLEEVMAQSGTRRDDIDAIAFTQGPGLAGALLVGASIANALALAWNKPTVGIHHLEGHLLSPLLVDEPPPFPFVALLVSGGHTQLMRVTDVGVYETLGETLDDAAGEAFDKTAKLIGLGYPGGPEVSKLAETGTPGAVALPRPMLHSGDLDFSFSGLKTAVLTQMKKFEAAKLEGEALERAKADLARGFVDAAVDVLVAKSLAALKKTKLKRLVVAGGVGANRQLRAALSAAAAKRGFDVHYPDLALCTDNGAMIALAGALRLGRWPEQANADYAFTVKPRWDLASLAH